MSEKTIEKSFLYLLALSVLLHLVAYRLVSLIPAETVKKAEVTTMVDLSYLPQPANEVKKTPAPAPKPKHKPEPEQKPKPKPQPPKPKPEPPKTAVLPKPEPPKAVLVPQPPPLTRPPQPRPLDRELFTGKYATERKASPPPKAANASPAGTDARTRTAGPATPKAGSGGLPFDKGGKVPVARGEGLLKPHKGERTELARLFPNARKMESLEETYRQKYSGLEHGDTRMIDTKDPLISVFSSRLLVAANDNLHFHAGEVVIDKSRVGVLQVIVRRDGSIEDVQIMESTEDSALDDFFIRMVKTTGYVGPLPKKWPYDQLKLIWIATARR